MGPGGYACPTRMVRAARLAGPVHPDGRLDEPAWDGAETADGFTQTSPDPGAPATERTEARVLYDDQALYVGIRLHDSKPDSISAQLARRDAYGIYSDWVYVFVDSYFDRRTAFVFSTNPRGVQRDALIFDDARESPDWDAVWEVATAVDSVGWVAEFRIPLSQLRFDSREPVDGRVWGLQIQREIARRQEVDSWSPKLPQDPGFVSRFGVLAGLRGIRPAQRIELQPFVSGRLTRAPRISDDPFYRTNDVGINAGADVKVGLTAGLTLTGAINPDFGQVEVDPAVVNLTVFETFFPEKRPFFVEGSDIFQFGQTRTYNNAYGLEQFFYSRRIGRPPQIQPDGEVHYINAPGQSTILAAAKLSGKAGPWSIGFMDAVTGRETARFLTTSGERGSVPVEPLTNHLVGRLRRSYRGGNTVVGGMATAAHRDLNHSLLYASLRSSAYLTGLDVEHSWAQRTWTLAGFVAGSHVQGSKGVVAGTQRSSARYYQRPDAGYVQVDPERSSLDGYMGEIALKKTGTWYGSLDYKEASPGFEISDLGYLYRADFRGIGTTVAYRRNEPGRRLRNFSLSGFTNHAWNFGRDQIYEGYGASVYGTFTNLWNAAATLSYSPEFLSDRLTRGGPVVALPRQWQLSASGGSDSRKRFALSGSVSYVEDESGGRSRSMSLGLDVRPSSAMRIRLGPYLSRDYSTSQFVLGVDDALADATYGTRFVFADLDQTTLTLDTRLDWTFSPKLSLQLYAQPFVAAGDYAGYKELERSRTNDFAVYGMDRGWIQRGTGCANPAAKGGTFAVDPDGPGPGACFGVPDWDFTYRSLRGNAVLRWEYRPGSALFLVWQQQRAGTAGLGTFDFDRDASRIFREPATNVLLVKATYWMGK